MHELWRTGGDPRVRATASPTQRRRWYKRAEAAKPSHNAAGSFGQLLPAQRVADVVGRGKGKAGAAGRLTHLGGLKRAVATGRAALGARSRARVGLRLPAGARGAANWSSGLVEEGRVAGQVCLFEATWRGVESVGERAAYSTAGSAAGSAGERGGRGGKGVVRGRCATGEFKKVDVDVGGSLECGVGRVRCLAGRMQGGMAAAPNRDVAELGGRGRPGSALFREHTATRGKRATGVVLVLQRAQEEDTGSASENGARARCGRAPSRKAVRERWCG